MIHINKPTYFWEGLNNKLQNDIVKHVGDTYGNHEVSLPQLEKALKTWIDKEIYIASLNSNRKQGPQKVFAVNLEEKLEERFKAIDININAIRSDYRSRSSSPYPRRAGKNTLREKKLRGACSNGYDCE